MLYLCFFGCWYIGENEIRKFADDPNHDFDGDGYTEEQGDCDDEDENKTPETLWYNDTDEDGFGNSSSVLA